MGNESEASRIILTIPNFVEESLETTFMTSVQLFKQIFLSEFLTIDNIVWTTIFGLAVVLWYYLFWKPFDWYRVRF